jgi:hypothetical protein
MGEGEKRIGSLISFLDNTRINAEDLEEIIQYVHNLKFKDKRENALVELSK